MNLNFLKNNFNHLLILAVLLCCPITFAQQNITCLPGFVVDGDICLECGVSFSTPNVRINSKIVGGVEAVPNSWPAQVLIYIRQGPYISVCGGSLIRRDLVLTAAHCLMSTSNPSDYQVILGLHDRFSINYEVGVVNATVKEVIVHQSFSDRSFIDDIGLLVLNKRVILSEKIQLACLPQSKSISFPLPGQPSWVVGWGTTRFEGSSSPELRNVKLDILDGPNYCSRYSGTDWKSQICSGVFEGGKDSCQGDSGGPLYVLDTIGGKSKYVVAGIVSYGYECARPGFPGIYTRVTSYMNWIGDRESTNNYDEDNTSNNLRSTYLLAPFLIMVSYFSKY